MPFFTRSILTIFFISGLLSLLGTSTQTQDRTIRRSSSRNEPIKVTAVKVKSGIVKLNQKFIADEDWLRGLTITVKNTSVGKMIKAIHLVLEFPETPSPDMNIGWTLDYGQASSPLIAPGEKVDLTLSDEEYDILRNSLKQNQYPASIKQLEFLVSQVVFSDGTMWSAGRFYRQDSNSPNKWTPIGSENSKIRNNKADRTNPQANFALASFTPFSSNIGFHIEQFLFPYKASTSTPSV